MELTIDFESRSPIDIKKCGGYVYWQHPRTEAMMLSVKVDDDDTRVWVAPPFRHLCDTEVSTEELQVLLELADIIIAHNAGFERNGFKYGMTKYGFSPLPIEKVRCTASQALMCGFPRDLESASKYSSGGSVEKDTIGHNIMLKMAKPRAFNKEDAVPLLQEFIERGHLKADATWKDVKAFQSSFIKEYALTGVGDQWLEDTCIVYRENAEDFCRLVAYARQDVEAERALYKRLPHIPESELAVYRWSETVNDRGIRVDRDSAVGVVKAVEQYGNLLMKRVLELTDGEVTSMKAPESIKTWLRKRGKDVDSVDKGSVDFLLSLDLEPDVREFLEIRKKLGKSSIAKYNALLNYSSHDGRFRGGFVYHAAATGRFGGSGPQLQNLPRPSEKNSTMFKEFHADRKDIELLCTEDFDLVHMFWKDPMVLAADLIRPTLIASEGKDLISADFSAVEARGLAWVAGEEAALDGFRRGLDAYKVAASGIYRIPYEEVDGGGKGPQRQVGKTAVLACVARGTMVLVRRGIRFARKPIETVQAGEYVWDGEEWVRTDGAVFKGIKEVVHYDGIWTTRDHIWFIRGKETEMQAISDCVVRDMVEVYDLLNCGPKHRFAVVGRNDTYLLHNCGYGGGWNAMLAFGADRMGLTEEEGIAIVKAWRAANPNITALWYDLQRASMKAMRFKGERIKVRPNVSFLAVGNFLTMRLPSGRNLFYPFPKLTDCPMPWEDANGNQAVKKMVTAMTLTAAKQWVRRPLSHVTLVENLVQALCRDLLMFSAKNLEAAGYPVIAHIHDEVVCEVDEGFGSLEEFENIMAKLPDWAGGFPLAAEGWRGKHYRK